jgi:hypothetical protein
MQGNHRQGSHYRQGSYYDKGLTPMIKGLTKTNLTAYAPHSPQLQKLVDGHILDEDVEGCITEVLGTRVSSIWDLSDTLDNCFHQMAEDLQLNWYIFMESLHDPSVEIPGYVTFRGWGNFSRRSPVKEQFCFQVIQ